MAKTCMTCLYMATHEQCDNCLNTQADYAANRAGQPMPEFRYAHWTEGNWVDRIIQAEIDGTHSIVIGGQGEAEVNTRQTPQEAHKNLCHVAEECGYYVRELVNENDGGWTTRIATNDGDFRLHWDAAGKLQMIVNIENPKGWHWENVNPFRQIKKIA